MQMVSSGLSSGPVGKSTTRDSGRLFTKSFSQLREDANETGVQFLLTEVDTGLTFLEVASVTNSDETRKRNYKNARLAYDTVVRLKTRLLLTGAQRNQIETGLAKLRNILEGKGMQFDAEPEP
jgi:hypothetical protein